jgi:integrase
MPWKLKGRDIWMMDFTVKGERRRLSSRITDRRVAGGIEAMLHEIGHQPHYERIFELTMGGRVHPALTYQAWKDGKLAEFQDSQHSSLTDPTVESLIPEWSQMLERDNVGRRGHYVLAIKRFCNEHPGLRVSKWTRAETTAYIDAMRKDGMAPATVRAHVAAMMRLFRWMVDTGICRADDRMAMLRLPKVPRGGARFLDIDCVPALLGHAPPEYRNILTFAYGAGVEASALAKLRWRDFDASDLTVYVRGTKTGYRERRVGVLGKFAYDLAKESMLHRPDEYVSPTRDRSKLSKIHRAAADQLGHQGTLHNARHSFAVALLKAGAPTKVVAYQLGHADETMVRRVYGEWIPTGYEVNKYAALVT